MDKYRMSRFGTDTSNPLLRMGGEDMKEQEEQEFKKKHKPLTKLNESIMQSIKNIEQEVKQKTGKEGKDKKQGDLLKSYMEDEDKKKVLERTKELYRKLPRTKEDIEKYALNWNALFKVDAVEKVGRPWIGKKIKEYMGVEDDAVVKLIMKILNAKPASPQVMRDKVKDILDEKTEEFVQKLWQTLIFENMKVDEGLYQ